ncbi:MAG: hypothetical protein JW910_14750 [Anaerolineae bacterium]|nr:hypothetical protein [Anaerolineae bacterium]
MSKARKQYPTIQGLTWHRTDFYSFFVPMDWHRFTWSDGNEGMIFGPDPDDPYTVFAVDIKDLGTPFTREDMAALAEGFFESIEQLPGCAIESREQNAVGNRLELAAQYTFQEDKAVRKCWVKVFYHQTRQIAMMARGATPDKYQYWLPWFYQAMMTARVHSQKPEHL